MAKPWRHPKSAPASRQLGLSVVEMLVGVAVGLFVVAGAGLMVSSQLVDNRRLLLETQIQQDLRSAADIVTRELRRASFSPSAMTEVWYEGRPSVIAQNTYGSLTPESGDPLHEVSFSYRKRSGDEGPFGFKQDGTVLKARVGGEWHVLTDSAVMNVIGFDINLSAPVTYQLPCPRLCPGDVTTCWPELQLRTATVTITGRSVSDSAVVRTLRTQVRLRNDWVHFNAADICPA